MSSKHVSIRMSLLSIFVSMMSIWYALGIGGSACLLQNSKLDVFLLVFLSFLSFKIKSECQSKE